MWSFLGWVLAAAGVAGLHAGCRRTAFADKAAEYLPACLLLQSAALLCWLADDSPGAALLRWTLCLGLAGASYMLRHRAPARHAALRVTRWRRQATTTPHGISPRPQRSGS